MDISVSDNQAFHLWWLIWIGPLEIYFHHIVSYYLILSQEVILYYIMLSRYIAQSFNCRTFQMSLSTLWLTASRHGLFEALLFLSLLYSPIQFSKFRCTVFSNSHRFMHWPLTKILFCMMNSGVSLLLY